MDKDINQEISSKIMVEKPQNFPTDLWSKLINFSEPLMDARKGFEHHTWTAVYWADKIAKAAIDEKIVNPDSNPQIDLTVLAFLHDLGYSGVTSGIYNDDKSRVTDAAKEKHQIISAELAEKFFSENKEIIGKYLDQQKQKSLVEIIRVHDSLAHASDNKLLALFIEVDSIATIDMRFGQPSVPKESLTNWLMTRPLGYKKHQNGKYERDIASGRYGVFLTSFGKTSYISLSKELIKYAKS